MSMIFDNFPTTASAERFAALVTSRHGLPAQTFATADAAQEHDLIPVQLFAPVVHVDRAAPRVERDVVHLVTSFHGVYVGT